METQISEVKTLALVRVPPGDCWTDEVSVSELPLVNKSTDNPTASLERRTLCTARGYNIFNSLLEAMEYIHMKSKRTITDFHLSAFAGKVYSVTSEEIPMEPEPEPVKFSLYGEY